MRAATKPRVAVVGAGISGLTAAYRLQEDAEVSVFEASDRVGGKILTEEVDGFLIECGPDVFLSRKPSAVALCEELGIETRPTNRIERGSFILRAGVLRRLPAGFGALIPARLAPLLRSPILSLKGKARVLVEPLVPARKRSGEESLGAFVRRRFGREMYDRLLGPLLGGIYGASPDQLSLEATFPHLAGFEREFGSLIRGAQAMRGSGDPGESPPFAAPRRGMSALPEAIAEKLGDRIRTGVEITALRPEGEHWKVGGEEGTYDAVVLATPAHVTGPIVKGVNGELAAELATSPYTSVRVVSLAYRREDVPHPLEGYGYLIPEAEGKPVRACTWSSTKLPGSAPRDHVLLRLYLGRGEGDPLLTAEDSRVLWTVSDEVRDTLGITAPPLFHRIHSWHRAQPAYTLGHFDRLRAIEGHLDSLPGVFLTGAAYRGVGIPDCIQQAEATSLQVRSYLTQT